ncbi:hypothetical protein DLM75_18045 [Leptospira stimsonii]|uniref:Uncharacterized protein n=1 Tax=Leptospira stimsonii TaxID=2202203 RepID=A0A396YVY4_9LEPT|nr:hypothetical protein DLM75_18045 [Leptospira stimsonii]
MNFRFEIQVGTHTFFCGKHGFRKFLPGIGLSSQRSRFEFRISKLEKMFVLNLMLELHPARIREGVALEEYEFRRFFRFFFQGNDR